jgi:hypothetical protein
MHGAISYWWRRKVRRKWKLGLYAFSLSHALYASSLSSEIIE